MWFFGPPPQPPHTDAWPGETDPDAGGLLIISARADIGPGLLFLVAA
jgi:hypothetical protein